MRRLHRGLAAILVASVMACGASFSVGESGADGGAGDRLDATTGASDAAADDGDVQMDIDATFDSGGDADSAALDGTVGAGNGVVELIAAADFTCARRRNGSVSCWGDNTVGELATGVIGGGGTGTPQVSTFPGTPVAISGDNATGCALLADTSVVCWGWNSFAQLGLDAGVDGGSATPIPIRYGDAGLTGALEVASGQIVNCARLAPLDGGTESRTVCWGYDSNRSTGQSGSQKQTTLPVPGLSGTKQTSVYNGTSCAITDDDFVDCWGNGLGPTRISLLDGGSFGQIARVGVGNQFTCALRTDGSVWCWGANNAAQLGRGIDAGASVLPTVPTLSGATSLSVGAAHACVILDGGAVDCWGFDPFREVAPDASTCAAGARCVPKPVLAPLPAPAVYAWGINNFGQLGRLPFAADICPTDADGSTATYCSGTPLVVEGIP